MRKVFNASRMRDAGPIMGCCDSSPADDNRLVVSFVKSDDPAVQFAVDRSYCGRAPVAGYEILAAVGTPLVAGEAGERDICRVKLAERANALWVGEIRCADWRWRIFYVDNLYKFEEAAKALFANPAESAWELRVELDGDWSYFQDILNPNPQELEIAGNEAVRQALEDAGDCLERSRIIRHSLEFQDLANARAFAKQAGRMGFYVDYLSKTREQDGLYWVEIEKWDAPAEIDALTLKLLDLASLFQGYYDGWGCPITMKSPFARARDFLMKFFRVQAKGAKIEE